MAVLRRASPRARLQLAGVSVGTGQPQTSGAEPRRTGSSEADASRADRLDAQRRDTLAVMQVACQGSWHTTGVRRGAWFLDGHPDRAAEAALLAMGSAQPECLRLRDLWRTAIAHPTFLVPWADADPDEFRSVRAELGQRLRHGGLPAIFRGMDIEDCRLGAEVITRFPPWLVDRAATAAIRRLNRRWTTQNGCGRSGDWALAAVNLATKLRLRRAFHAAFAGADALPLPPGLLHMDIRVTNGRPSIRGTLEGRTSLVQVTVRPTWLCDVWGSPGGAVCSRNGAHALVLDSTGGRIFVAIHDGGELRDATAAP